MRADEQGYQVNGKFVDWSSLDIKTLEMLAEEKRIEDILSNWREPIFFDFRNYKVTCFVLEFRDTPIFILLHFALILSGYFFQKI